MTNSTALTVKVQHCDAIHPVCEDGCQRRPTKVIVKLQDKYKVLVWVLLVWYKHAVGVLIDVG